MAAAFVVSNVGDGPLTVRSVDFLPGEPGAPRVPLGASASLERARDTKLAPGESRTVEVRWRAELARPDELMAFVAIETDSAAPGAPAFDPPAIVPVVADRRAGLARVASSVLVLLPLVVLALAALSGRVQALAGRALARVAASLFVVHAVLAAATASFVDPALTSADGNGGLQLVDHVPLPGGLTWSLGLDGTTAPLLLPTSLVVLAAAIAGRRVRLHGASFFAGLALLSTASFGAMLALDVRLLALFLALAAPAAYLLVRAGDAPNARRAAAAVATMVLASALVAGGMLVGLATAAGPGLDLAHGRVGSTWSIAELSRVVWAQESPRVLGMAPGVAAWALGAAALFVRAGAVSPITAPALRHAPPAARVALLGTALAPLGTVLVRIGFGAGASALASIATPLVATGLAVAAIGAADALRQTDLARVAGSSVVVHAGLALAALASRTPQGIEGAVAVFAWHGLAAALVALVAGALHHRVATSDGARLGGLSAEMPRGAAIAGVGLLAAGGLPGLAGFWGAGLAVLGLVARAPIAAAAAAIVLVAHAVALARVHRAVFGGALAAAWRSSKELEPFAGRFPDLRSREVLGAAPIAAALVVLGLHPRAGLAVSEAHALELHRRVDPAGPTQVADANVPSSCPSSTSSTSDTLSCASGRAS
jgi:NADH-quinone oxidoreductase subunit M